MTLKNSTKLALRRLGIEVSRYPRASADYHAFCAFTSVNPDVILDVGANDGGFARQCRAFGYRGDVVSFEPGGEAYARLAQSSANDPRWQAHRLGLGDEPAELTLHVASNAGASSSLLPMLVAHEQAAPDARYVAEERVPIRRLDEWYTRRRAGWSRPALKIDTQGFERQVLVGAGSLIDSIVAVQLEMSLVPLYDGGWLWNEAAGWLQQRGFRLAGVAPGFTDPSRGLQLQFDGVFTKE